MRGVPNLGPKLFTLDQEEDRQAWHETQGRKYEETFCCRCSCYVCSGPVIRDRCCRPFRQSHRQGNLQSRKGLREGDWQGWKSGREVPFLI